MRLVGVGLGPGRTQPDLDRAKRGEVAYLAVFPPAGLPVALGGVDYTLNPDAGTLWQLAVHGALQSCGIGTQRQPRVNRRAERPGERDEAGWCGTLRS